jgi:hypothetical protein
MFQVQAQNKHSPGRKAKRIGIILRFAFAVRVSSKTNSCNHDLALDCEEVTNMARETVIERPDGDKTTVRTDEKGTTVTHESGGGSTSGGDRHQERVNDYTKDGGKIISDKED